MELSKRLHMVASMVEKGSTVADVGCDHGYVAVYLIREGISPHVFAMDVNAGPLERAREHVEGYGLAAYIDVRLSDGLSGLPCRGGRPEADTLLAAGMGGRLTVKILEEGADKLAGMRWVILQPQSEPWLVRKSLRNAGYFITDENMILEEGKYYAVMKAVNLENLPDGFPACRLKEEERLFFRNRPELSEEEWEQAGDRYGSWLLIRRHPVLFAYLEDCLHKNAGILKGIAGLTEADFRPEKTGKRLTQLEEEQQLLKRLLTLYTE